MTTEGKVRLCDKHRGLLETLIHYGNGAMPLPQLRELCILFGPYANRQAINRAVRALQEADILTRQTWLDNNSDLLLIRKFVLRYFRNCGSQAVATPHRPRTMGPYVIQARKVEWLLELAKTELLITPQEIDASLQRHACTMFLRLPDLADYYSRYHAVLSSESPRDYQEQLDALKISAERREALARGGVSQPPAAPAVTTLEMLHRRGLYVIGISPKRRSVSLALFAERQTRASRILDWGIEAYEWLGSLLPYYRVIVYVYALDKAHTQALTSAMNCMVSPSTSYLERRLMDNHMLGLLDVAIRNSNFVDRWCGGVRRTDF